MATDKTPIQGASVLHKTKKRLSKKRDKPSPKPWRTGSSLLQRGLRRLAGAEQSVQKRPRRDQEKQMDPKRSPLWMLGLLLIICAGLCLCLQLDENSPTIGGFLESYKNQYHSIVNNRENYCERAQRLGNMAIQARHHVFHQDLALEQLEQALENTTHQIIALVGSSGVGKSLTASVLRNHFPWPENVKTLSWDTARPLRRVQSMLPNLVHCGQNLILIDNMTPKDAQDVQEIHELIRAREEISNGTQQPHMKQLTVVIMFSVNRLQSDEAFKADMKSLKQLPHAHVIAYAPLEPIHLLDCIRREASIEGLQLDDEIVEEILRGSDPSFSGCKPIRAKVLLYGKRAIESDNTDQKLEPGNSTD
ncbi:uncharacterized protein LOC108098060 [Drosophila ficusphila]|uniref:uncharacterized protein LOC108098060 n=1 Tax=Drosophila ficusphila TaxID=30025 RepID=UPI0007E7A416|nr:uncharacterized protein LOC108098060 [Drosophila ficusphila]XP_017056237.1 uncharacterized protein LOC108098060 [Drosophila ficusphila]